MTNGAFLFVTWDGGGNTNPVIAMAERLLRRGHRVRVLGSETLAKRFADHGLEFVARDPAREWDQDASADDVTATALDDEVLVVDYMLPGALCGAEATGLPVAAFVHTLYGAMLSDDDLGPMHMAATVDGINALRTRLALPPMTRLVELLDHADLVFVNSPERLDVRVDRPPNLRYVGPVLENAAVDASAAYDVVVSFGTTPMDEQDVLERVLAALADLPVRVLATVGAHVDVAGVAAPDNATVSGIVPHAAVLPSARLLVCHGGLGGILAALTYGVPILCLPLGRDQPMNADAVERVDAGKQLPPNASSADIRAAASVLLRGGATSMADDIKSYGNGAACIDALEGLL